MRRYVEWDMFAHKAGMMPVAKPVLTRLLNEKTKAEIVNLAIDVGGKAVRDAIAFMRYNLDLESFLFNKPVATRCRHSYRYNQDHVEDITKEEPLCRPFK